MLGGIAEGDTDITGFLAGEDCLATPRALRPLGVHIERPAPNEVLVHGVGLHGLARPPAPLDMGNAGTAMRLFMGLLAPQRFDSTLIGDESLMRRPMERVAAPLRLMGAHIQTHDGRPPVQIRGTPQLRAIDYSLPVASAQVKSAILLAGLQAAGRTRVTEPAPSRDHTERMLGAFGVSLRREGRTVALDGGQAAERGTRSRCRRTSPRRRSSSWPAASPPSGRCCSRNVGVNPDAHRPARAAPAHGRRHPRARAWRRRSPMPSRSPTSKCASSRCAASRVPESLVPLSIDEFPVFFVAAACAEGETLVAGRCELRVKESDRLAAMAAGLETLGVENQLLTDGLWIRGAESFAGGTVDSHGDHRIAMAFAVAALRARAPTRDPGRGQRRHLLSRLRRARARGRLGAGRGLTDTAAMAACPIVTIDGPSGSGKGTISRAVARRRRAGTCSTAARCTAWWRWPAPRPGWTRDDAGRHAALAAAHGRAVRRPVRRRRGGVALDGRDVTGRDPLRGGRAGGLPGGRLARGPHGPAGAPAGLRPAPGTGGRRARYGHRGLPRGPTSRSS